MPVLQPDGYPIAILAADNIVIRGNNPDPTLNQILLIKRGKVNDPYKGKLAFPGGKVEYGEDPKVGCLRELKEECSLEIKAGSVPQLLGVYGDPTRDIRAHTISCVYIVLVDEKAVPKAGDDAADAQFYLLADILKNPQQLAFDHAKILGDYIARFAKH